MRDPVYCTIIGDIDRSREIANRGEVQRRFEESLATINRDFKAGIASEFLVTLGDEFQGVLSAPGESLRIVRHLQSMMSPVLLSFGIGIGTLDTALKPVALGIDGEAFHRSREALGEAKAEGGGRVVYSFDGPGAKLVNFLVLFSDRRLAKVSRTTLKVHGMMKGRMSQVEVAKALGLTQQGVSRALRSKAFQEVVQIEDSLREFLQSLAGVESADSSRPSGTK
jgi:hypothetical protein